MMERSKGLKGTKKRKWSVRALAAMLIAILAMPTVGLKTHAEELTDSNIPNVNVTNKEVEYNSTVQPLTTMVDCEITMAFTLNGLEMTFTTLSVEVSSVIGVKDIKVQQKMWYGWKTVMTSSGAENYNEDMFILMRLMVKPTGYFALTMQTMMFTKKLSTTPVPSNSYYNN